MPRRPKLKTRATTFRHQPELMAEVDALAQKVGVSRNRLIEMALTEFVTQPALDVAGKLLAEVEARDAQHDLFS